MYNHFFGAACGFGSKFVINLARIVVNLAPLLYCAESANRTHNHTILIRTSTGAGWTFRDRNCNTSSYRPTVRRAPADPEPANPPAEYAICCQVGIGSMASWIFLQAKFKQP